MDPDMISKFYKKGKAGMKKRVALLMFATTFCGCMNVMQHVAGEAPPFSGCGSVLQMCAYAPEMTIPGIAMLPVEFCADIVTLPYDLFARD